MSNFPLPFFRPAQCSAGLAEFVVRYLGQALSPASSPERSSLPERVFVSSALGSASLPGELEFVSSYSDSELSSVLSDLVSETTSSDSVAVSVSDSETISVSWWISIKSSLSSGPAISIRSKRHSAASITA